MSKLAGKVAIVTGASKGIGAGIAKELASQGASVVVNYSSSKEGADKVVKAIVDNGGKAVAVQGDVAKSADVKRIFEETKTTFGPVDILVNNAGVFKFMPVEEIPEDEFHRQYGTNILGPILTTQQALTHFGPDGGSIINISSVAATSPVANSALYASTKGALDTLTVALALELAPKNIRVNGISPGYTDSEGARGTGFFDGENEKHLSGLTPLGRLGQPADIAKVTAFLASDDSAWMTGETIRVSGGLR